MEYQVSLGRNKAGTWELIVIEKHPKAAKKKRLEARRIISIVDSPAQDLILEQVSASLEKINQQLREARDKYV